MWRPAILVALLALLAGGCGEEEREPERGRSLAPVERKLRDARPGDVVVLAPGTYGRRGAILRVAASGRPGAPVTLRGPARGPRPRLLGQVRVEGRYVRLRRIAFEGPTGPVAAPGADNPDGEDVQIWIRGAHATVADSVVRGNRWHAGIFVSADDARIVRNHIYDNGVASDPRRATLDHGIYWSSGRGGLIARNRIERNAGFGIQLYPEATGVRVVANVVTRNGGPGVLLAGATSDVTVAGNVVAHNGGAAVSADLDGTGNSLRDNLFWANGAGAVSATEGLAASGNVVADPATAPLPAGTSNIR